MSREWGLATEAHRQFMAHCENAIADNLRLGYRGELWCWVEIKGEKLICHAARQPPVGEDGRFQWHVLKYDLSDERMAKAFLERHPAPAPEPKP